MDWRPSPGSLTARRPNLVPRAVIERLARFRASRPSARGGRVSGAHRRPAQVNRLLALLILGIAVTAVVSLAQVLGDTRHNSAAPTSTTRGQPGAAPTAATRALVHWVLANLPAGTVVVADPTAASLLQSGGYRGATSDPTACRAGRFIFVTPALKQVAQGLPLLAGCIDHSLAVASLGADRVREVTPNLTGAVRARRAAVADRRRGGVALAGNPSITMSAATRAALRDGQLDLRGEAVLAELAAHIRLRLRAVAGAQAEIRAGMPARTVKISVPHPAVIHPLLTHVAADYRPSKIVRTTPHIIRLTWPFRAGPLPVLD